MFKSTYRYLYVLLLAVYSYLNIKFTEGDQLLGESVQEVYLMALIGILVLLIWEGNRFLFGTIRFTKKRIPPYLLISFLASLVLVATLSVLSTWISVSIGLQSTALAFKLSLGFVFRVNLFLHCVNAIVFYQQLLRKTEINMELAEKENLLANYNALKRQISPHFLFNSLNVLDELIAQDPKRASDFLARLSKVYRYVTRNQTVDLVALSDEVEFMKSYSYLLEARFQNHLTISLSISDAHLDKKILPAALQILVENTIKHNEISSSKNLTVSIRTEAEYVVVENTIQPKTTSSDRSLGIGLQNIQKRYQFFIDKEVKILNDGSVFAVWLPLLTSE
ncbi:sensor histidine kinase [Marinoscillum sp.]|uniref:sensor histidine kinase n=1 Tax=Marinoscillum sp. TaxID=2024838 RepID=UPI003BA92656